MNLCDTCIGKTLGACPEVGSAVQLCVEYSPTDQAACKDAQLWHAANADNDAHWAELCRMIEWERKQWQQ